MVVALAALAVAAGYFYLHRTPKLTAKDTIILARIFTNKTGDPVRRYTPAGLDCSAATVPVLELHSRSEDLAHAQTDGKAGELCSEWGDGAGGAERVGARAMFTGGIATPGSQYVLEACRLTSRGAALSARFEPPGRVDRSVHRPGRDPVAVVHEPVDSLRVHRRGAGDHGRWFVARPPHAVDRDRALASDGQGRRRVGRQRHHTRGRRRRRDRSHRQHPRRAVPQRHCRAARRRAAAGRRDRQRRCQRALRLRQERAHHVRLAAAAGHRPLVVRRRHADRPEGVGGDRVGRGDRGVALVPERPLASGRSGSHLQIHAHRSSSGAAQHELLRTIRLRSLSPRADSVRIDVRTRLPSPTTTGAAACTPTQARPSWHTTTRARPSAALWELPT